MNTHHNGSSHLHSVPATTDFYRAPGEPKPATMSQIKRRVRAAEKKTRKAQKVAKAKHDLLLRLERARTILADAHTSELLADEALIINFGLHR